MSSVKIWLAETRPQFLLLTPVCIFTGVAASLYAGYSFNALYFVLAAIGAGINSAAIKHCRTWLTGWQSG